MKKIKLFIYLCICMGVLLMGISCTKADKEGEQVQPTQALENEKVTVSPTKAPEKEIQIPEKPDGLDSWAAIYEKNKGILTFNKDGSVTYKGKEYSSYSVEDQYLFLHGTEELKMRYAMKNDKMQLYDCKEYKRMAIEGKYTDVAEGSIEGFWKYDEHYSYEFTEKGTFYEDQNFPGYYAADPENHTIKLMYNDKFEDTILYYELNGDVLTIEYPWSLVPTQSE